MKIEVVRRGVPYLLVVLILAAVAFAAGNLLAGRSSAEAQGPGPEASAAPEGGAVCTIVDLGALDNRMHVKCLANTGGVGPAIVWFAAPTGTAAEAREANRYMAMLTVAWAFSKKPTVFWADSSSLNPPGCLATDCRRLTGVVLQ